MRILFYCLSFLLLFAACNDPDTPQLGSCLPALDVRFDSLWVPGDSGSIQLVEKLFAPSAFTPNGDFINDTFQVQTYLVDSNATYTYVCRLFINNQLYLSKSGSCNAFSGNPLFVWDGKNASGQIQSGIYRLDIAFLKNQSFILQQSHYFYLLQPNASGLLPSQSQCITFSDQYDSRLGIVYETAEVF